MDKLKVVVILGFLVALAFSIALWVGGIWAALHFIIKYW